MKVYVIVLLSIAVIGYSQKTELQPRSEGANLEYFSIDIEQDGKLIPKVGETISLEKSPFIIYVNFYETQGIDISASWGREYYDFPSSENIYNCNMETYSDECRFWGMKAGAEERYNEDKDILVGDLSYQVYWACDDKDYWKDFNHLDSTRNDVVTGTMIVENIFDLDKRDLRKFEEPAYHYPIEQIDRDIFFVMATSHYEKGMEFPEELQREKFILKFK